MDVSQTQRGACPENSQEVFCLVFIKINLLLFFFYFFFLPFFVCFVFVPFMCVGQSSDVAAQCDLQEWYIQRVTEATYPAKLI